MGEHTDGHDLQLAVQLPAYLPIPTTARDRAPRSGTPSLVLPLTNPAQDLMAEVQAATGRAPPEIPCSPGASSSLRARRQHPHLTKGARREPALTSIDEGPHLCPFRGLSLFPHGAVRLEAHGAERARLDAPDPPRAEEAVVRDADEDFAALASGE